MISRQIEGPWVGGIRNYLCIFYSFMNLSKIIKFKSMKFWQHQSSKVGQQWYRNFAGGETKWHNHCGRLVPRFSKQNLYLTLDNINIFILSKSLETSGLNKIMYMKVYSRCIYNTRQHLKMTKKYSSRSKNILICIETLG